MTHLQVSMRTKYTFMQALRAIGNECVHVYIEKKQRYRVNGRELEEKKQYIYINIYIYILYRNPEEKSPRLSCECEESYV